MSERLIGIPEAAKISGKCRVTIQRWIDCGWLRVEEIPHGFGVRYFVTRDALRDAEETAANAPHEAVRIWKDPGAGPRVIPREGTRQHRDLRLWLIGKGRDLL